MDRVDGKTAFITGGARGIGLGIARAFARARTVQDWCQRVVPWSGQYADHIEHQRRAASSSATVQETKIPEAALTQAKAFLAAGADPDEVDEMVLAAVKADRLYIHTDRIAAGLIEARAKALLDAIPPVK